MANQPKKYKKFVATAATATLVASAIVPVASAASFSDVADTNSHAEAINALVEAGIIKGYEDGTFKPNATLTRGHVVKMLGKWVETQGFEIPADYDKVARFTDLAVDAADQELVKYAALVKDTGVFNGLADGSLNAKGDITRENMALTLDRAYKAVFGKTLVELAEGVEDLTVTDLATAKAEAREAIQALRDLEISNVDTFNPKDTVKRGQFASFLHRTINVADAAAKLKVESVTAVNGTLTVKLAEKAETVDVKDFTVTQAINGGEAKEVTPSKAELAEDGLTVTLTVPEVAVDATADQSVVYTVNKVAAEAFVVAATPKVESVSAINANQIEVKFNQAVEKSAAENLANYLLEGKVVNNGASTSVNTTLSTAGTFGQTPKATLQADGKTVLITLDTDANSTTQVLEGQVKQKLTIENVKTASGKEISKTAVEFTHIDTTVPTVQSVTTEGNRVVVVKFSEFVTADTATKPANYQIDGVSLTAYGAGTGVYNAETNEVRFTLSSALADKEYKFKYSVDDAIVDAAGFKVVETVTDLTIKADTTVAKVTSVEVVKPSNGANYILVKFSKPLAATSDYITGSPVLVDGKSYQTSVENGALKITDATVTTNGAHAINILNNSTNYLVDAYGIKIEAGSINYTVEADAVKPTVTSTKVLDGNKQIEVKFSEKVDATTAQNRLNYTIKNAKGTEQTIESAKFKTGSQDTVVLTLSSALKAGTFSLEAKNVKDQASPANTMDAYTGSLTVVDTVKPTVSNVEYSGTNVYVTFSEDMNTTTITDKANYLFDNKELPSDAKVTAISNTVAKIEFATGTTVAGKKFAVSTAVKDVAGNQLSGFGYETTITNAFTVKSLDVDVTTSGEKKVYATGKYTVAVTLNKALELLDAGEFEYSVDGGTTWIAFTQQSASFTTTDGKSTITFTLDKNAKGNSSDDTIEKILHNVTKTDNIKIKTNVADTSKTKATDGSTLAGGVLTTAGIVVNDKMAPAVEFTSDYNSTKATYNVVAEDKVDVNGKVDTLTITFTENLKAGSVSKDDFAVTGLEVKDVAVSSNKVTLTLKEGSVSDTADTIGVTFVGEIEDAAGNVLKADTNKTYYIPQTAAAVGIAKNIDLINTEAASGNWNTVTEATFTAAGVTGVVSGNFADVKATVKAAYDKKTSALTQSEIQTAVNDTVAVLAEAAKYETAVTVEKTVVANSDIDATVIKLKADQEAAKEATISDRTPADGTNLKVDQDKFKLKAVATNGGGDKTEKAEFVITIGNAKKTVSVTVTIKEQD